MADRARSTGGRRAATPQPRRAGAGIDARSAALALVLGVLRDHRTLPELRADRAGQLARLGPPDQARALRLAMATLRHLGPADATLKPYLRKAPPEPVQTLLRLAVTEMRVFDAPAHGVVNAAVRQARGARATVPLAGLVNAVLRKVAAEDPPRWAMHPPTALPRWLRAPLRTAWGPAAVTAMEAAHSRGAPLDLTLRDPVQGAKWAGGLDAAPLPTGSLRLAPDDRRAVSALPGYAEGAWWVQDAAAALPARLLDTQPGERVLDLCAAPGGKTMQLAATGADVTALDLSAARMDRLHANLERTGLRAEVVVADALDWCSPAPFDAILLDAPCTASGTIRRHPDMPHLRGLQELATLTALQARLLDRVLDPRAGLLRPGGRVVFCTCSVLPAEGEAQLAAALARHPEIGVMHAQPAGVPDDWLAPAGGLRIRPDFWGQRGGIDGFFMALLAHVTPAETPA